MSEFDLPKQCWSLTSSSIKTKKYTQFYILVLPQQMSTIKILDEVVKCVQS